MASAVQKHEALARDRMAARARRQSLTRQVGSDSWSRAVGVEGIRVDACCCWDFVGGVASGAGMLWGFLVGERVEGGEFSGRRRGCGHGSIEWME